MKRFFQNVCLFFIVIFFVFVLFIWSSSKLDRKDRALTNDAVFVWGDSQMYQGLAIDQLSDSIGQEVYSSACHGAGVYDFLVFVDKVPDSASVIISFPECALYRDPRSDNNRSGMNYYALKTLYHSGYPTKELQEIAKTNKYRGINTFTNKPSYLYAYADSIVYPEPLEGFVKMFSKTDEYISHKIEAYMSGVQTLSEKGCRLCFISFPFDQSLESLILTSRNRVRSDSVASIIKKYELNEIQIHFQSDSLIMHDLSHMNEVGARKLTELVANYYSNSEYFFIKVSCLINIDNQ